MGIGRIGRRQRYASDFERFKATIIKTVFDLADKAEGALIVLEGETPMDDIVSTGISMGVDVVSSELLETNLHG